MSETWMGILALAQPAEGGSQPNFLVNMLPIVLIFAMFYFLMIAPARKKQKRHAELLSALKTGDKVITNGGIHGTVAGLTEQVIQLKIADQVKIDVSRNAIAGLQSES